MATRRRKTLEPSDQPVDAGLLRFLRIGKQKIGAPVLKPAGDADAPRSDGGCNRNVGNDLQRLEYTAAKMLRLACVWRSGAAIKVALRMPRSHGSNIEPSPMCPGGQWFNAAKTQQILLTTAHGASPCAHAGTASRNFLRIWAGDLRGAHFGGSTQTKVIRRQLPLADAV